MKRFFIILTLITITIPTYSTHLMGGEITYTCIKSGPKAGFYVFNVVVYRDCQGVPIDTTTTIKVHNNPLLQEISLNYIESRDISPSCNTLDGINIRYSCGVSNQGSSGNGIGAVEEHTYRSDTIKIFGTPDNNGWHFTWSDCCRNGSIINILNPNSYGFTLRTAMYPYTDSSGVVWPNNNNCYDNSPVFYEKPRTILEAYNGFDSLSLFNGFTYSHNAYDAELDSISYEFAPPLDESNYDYLNPNSTSIPFVSPFSYNAPINSINIDPYTGRTSYPADVQGNYVTCTKVSSYRCGQLISEVYREIQIVITAPICNLGDTTNGNVGANTLCNTRPKVQAPFYYPNLLPQYQWDTIIHCGDTVSFEFIANDYDFYPNGSRQDLLFEVSGGQFYDYLNNQPCQNPPCATFEEISTGVTPPFISSGGQGGGIFNWFTNCNQLNNGCYSQGPNIYSFVIKVSDDFCPAPAIENTSQVISIIVYPPCSNLKVGITTTDATCSLNDGVAISNPFGGTPPYTKYWTDLNGVIINPDSLSIGTYLIRVADSTLCETIDTFTINGPPSFSVTSSISNVDCNGGNNGSINISTSNFLSYLWSNGAITQDISSLTAGVYSLLCTDTFGCTNSQSFTIFEPSILSSQNNLTDVSCFGFNNGSIDLSIIGGTIPYQVIWSTGDTIEDLINLSSGIYSVAIYDSNSCSIVDSFIVAEPSILSNLSSSSNVSCNGFSDANINSITLGGTPPYSYSWNSNDTTADLYNVSAGIYILSLNDNNGCLYIDSVLVTEPDTLAATIMLNSNLLTGSAIGGTPPYLYDFYNSNGLYLSSTNSTGSDVTVNLPTMGVYSFVITDANNCTDSTSVIYGNYFDPFVNVILSNVYCDSLSNLTIIVSQDSGQVDMSTALFQSNAGYFDIISLNVGDTIGTADLMANGGALSINTMLVVSSIISSSQAVVSACSWVNGCLGSFVITNSSNGGIEILTQTVPDGNNFTEGNMSSVTFENLFVNPCTPLIFTSVINSELGAVDSTSIVFYPSLIINYNNISEISVFPNPSKDVFNIKFTSLLRDDIQLQIINLIGEVIHTENIKNHIGEYRTSVNLDTYSSGIYLLEIQTTSGLISKKLLMQ